MRRLVWLTLGVALAWYGFGLIAEGESFATFRLRDGLIVALVGALLFAWHTLPMPPPSFSGGQRQWPVWGRILAGTGVVCGAAAAVLLTLWGEQSWTHYLGGSLWAIGTLTLLVGLFWPGRVEIYPAPAFRWRVDAAGNYVRYALDDPDQPADPAPLIATGRYPLYYLLLFLLFGVGILLRVWRLTTLPPTCVDVECALALRLVEGDWPQGFRAEAVSLFALLTRLLYTYYSGESVAALRWAGAILGILALPVTFWAARTYMKPAGALVTLLVVALLPWAVWSSRVGTVWSATPLLLALVLGLAGRAIQRPSHRWWGMTGVALALLLIQPIPLWGATLVWTGLLAAVAIWVQQQMPAATQNSTRRAWIDHAALMAGCTLALGLPLAIPQWQATYPGGFSAFTPNANGMFALLAALLDSGGATLDYFMRQPLLPAWGAALALVGLATLLRHVRQPHAAVVAGGALLNALALIIFVPSMTTAGMVAATAPTLESAGLALPLVSGAEAWLALLPFLAIAAGVAVDQWLTTFDRAWSILVPLPRVVAVVALVLVMLAGRATVSMMGQLGRGSSTAQNETEVAMGQYLAACLRGEATDDPCSQSGEGMPTFYVPAAAISHPSTRLLLGAALERGRVRPFDPSRDLLPTTTPTGDLFYLVALDNQPVIELLRQLYPTAQMHAEPTDRVGPTLFLVIQIPLADVLNHQGLAGTYFAGEDSTANPTMTRIDGPLRFDWADNPPLEGPFNVLWEGSLLVPEAGTYLFALAGAADGSDAPVISVQLDGNLLLDSSLGLVEKGETLAQGAYQLTMRYRTRGTATNWALQWTPPGGAADTLARNVLYSPPLPNIGLLGTYYAGSTWDGPALAVRKDMVLGAPVDLPSPYSVHWTGKIAATRAGEYFFAVTANGPVTVAIDGRETLFHTPGTDLASSPGYSQASIYLEQGWHDLNLRYAPNGASDLRVLWQPPGSGPLLLAGRYLVPTQAPITMADVPLPPAPELVNARLGGTDFALSANLEPYQPMRHLTPTHLPQLVAEPVWTVGNGCGVGDIQFASPRGVAVDAQNGRVYVADTENRRVVELMLADGSRVTAYNLPEFQEPVDVALDPGGALLVLDATVQNIFRIDRATGEAAMMALGTGFYHPRGLTVDWAGNIAVADTGGARVALLDATGNFLTQYGGLGTGLGQGQPADVLAIGNELWAIAADHGRLWQLGSLGSLAVTDRASTVTGPQLAALPDGSGFFMSDPVRRTVIYFAPSGQPVGQLGYADVLLNPVGVAAAFAPDGLVNLVVGDSAACSVSLWRLRAQS